MLVTKGTQSNRQLTLGVRLASVWSSPNLFAAGSILGGGCCLERGRGAIISVVLIACIRSVGGTYIELRVNSSRRYCYITTCKRMLHKVMRHGLGDFHNCLCPFSFDFSDYRPCVSSLHLY